MPQLYCQLASRPDPWLLGRTSAGLCTLQTACPLTATYSGGSPAPDTIAAGSAATVYGGSAATFDASADVWVVLTAPGSGALQVTKEADLAAVTGEWAGLARVVQHAMEPYQPQAYLASGGLGVGASPTSVVNASGSACVGLSLWNGSGNDAPPTDWEQPTFDDSAWAHPVDKGTQIAAPYTPQSDNVWPESSAPSTAEQALFRQTFTPAAGTITAVTLWALGNRGLNGIWLNGTAIAGTVGETPAHFQCTVTVAPSLLTAGAANTIAVWAKDPEGTTPTTSAASWQLQITTGGLLPLASLPGHHTTHESGGSDAITGPLDGNARVAVDRNGTLVGTRRALNVIEGTGVTLTVADNSGGERVDVTVAATGTGGTVTSVALAGPTGTTVSGSPITGSGTLTLSWASQTANTVLAAPNGSSGAPTFRALVGNDIPVDASTITSSAGVIKGNYQAGAGVSISGNTISAVGSGGSVTSVALSVPGIFSLSGSPITTSGTLAVTLATQAAHAVFAGPASGSAAAPTFRALQSSDLPKATGAGGKIHAHGNFL